jgi:hypothetical protein
LSQDRDTQQPAPPSIDSLAPGNYSKTQNIPMGESQKDVSDYEVRSIFAGMTEIELKTRLNTLYRKGWYGSSKPSPVGWKDKDLKAFKDFYMMSKANQMTWQDGFTVLNKAPDMELSDGRSGRARPSSEDLKEVLQRTSLETMGKRLDDAAAQRLVDSYQGVVSGATTEQAPSADVFFQNRIESQYGAESESYKYLNAISNVSKVLGSL